MKRKLLAIVLALAIVLLATPLVGTVFAGKGQTKQSFEFSYKEYPFAIFGEESHASPKGSEGMPYPDQRTFHGRGCTHISPLLEYTLTIGGEPILTPFTKEGGCDFEFNAKTMMVIHRATDKLTFGSDGTVVLSIIEKINYGTMESEGTFVGFGTGIFENVKIVGTTSSGIVGFDAVGPILQVTHSGTVMDWP